MSPDQDPQKGEQDDIEQVFRAAEEAVDKVRTVDEDGVEIVDDTDEADDPADDPATQLAAAAAEAAALKDKWLRAVADHENYKKRVKRDIDDAVHRAVQGLLGSFLPVGDNLERALSVIPEDTSEKIAPLIKGIEMVRQEFFSALAKQGIKPIPSVGTPFDPNVHEALQQADSEEYAPGVVMMEYEKGYTRGDKLLRPARVIVAGPGSTGTKGQSASEADDGAANEAN